MQVINWGIVVFLSVLVMSCQTNYRDQDYDREDYISWIQSRDFSWEKKVDRFVTRLDYIPGDYKLLMDYRSRTANLADSLRLRYQNFEYYKLTINTSDGHLNLTDLGSSNHSDYSGRLEFLLSEIRHDFYMVTPSDTIYCLDSYFERSYGMQNGLTFLLTFPVSSTQKGERTFVYDERLFNLGKLKFKQDLEKIYNIPTLKL